MQDLSCNSLTQLFAGSDLDWLRCDLCKGSVTFVAATTAFDFDAENSKITNLNFLFSFSSICDIPSGGLLSESKIL